MNDAPTMTEAPPLDGNAIAELAEQLNQLLRLRTFPIGMKLFEDLDAMANVPGLRRPPKGRTFSTCQLVTQARMAGFTLGITTENIPSFPPALALSGWTHRVRFTPLAGRWRACGLRTARLRQHTRQVCREFRQGSTTAWWSRRCGQLGSIRLISVCFMAIL